MESFKEMMDRQKRIRGGWWTSEFAKAGGSNYYGRGSEYDRRNRIAQHKRWRDLGRDAGLGVFRDRFGNLRQQRPRYNINLPNSPYRRTKGPNGYTYPDSMINQGRGMLGAPSFYYVTEDGRLTSSKYLAATYDVEDSSGRVHKYPVTLAQMEEPQEGEYNANDYGGLPHDRWVTLHTRYMDSNRAGGTAIRRPRDLLQADRDFLNASANRFAREGAIDEILDSAYLAELKEIASDEKLDAGISDEDDFASAMKKVAPLLAEKAMKESGFPQDNITLRHFEDEILGNLTQGIKETVMNYRTGNGETYAEFASGLYDKNRDKGYARAADDQRKERESYEKYAEEAKRILNQELEADRSEALTTDYPEYMGRPGLRYEAPAPGYYGRLWQNPDGSYNVSYASELRRIIRNLIARDKGIQEMPEPERVVPDMSTEDKRRAENIIVHGTEDERKDRFDRERSAERRAQAEKERQIASNDTTLADQETALGSVPEMYYDTPVRRELADNVTRESSKLAPNTDRLLGAQNDLISRNSADLESYIKKLKAKQALYDIAVAVNQSTQDAKNRPASDPYKRMKNRERQTERIELLRKAGVTVGEDGIVPQLYLERLRKDKADAMGRIKDAEGIFKTRNRIEELIKQGLDPRDNPNVMKYADMYPGLIDQYTKQIDEMVRNRAGADKIVQNREKRAEKLNDFFDNGVVNRDSIIPEGMTPNDYITKLMQEYIVPTMRDENASDWQRVVARRTLQVVHFLKDIYGDAMDDPSLQSRQKFNGILRKMYDWRAGGDLEDLGFSPEEAEDIRTQHQRNEHVVMTDTGPVVLGRGAPQHYDRRRYGLLALANDKRKKVAKFNEALSKAQSEGRLNEREVYFLRKYGPITAESPNGRGVGATRDRVEYLLNKAGIDSEYKDLYDFLTDPDNTFRAMMMGERDRPGVPDLDDILPNGGLDVEEGRGYVSQAIKNLTDSDHILPVSDGRALKDIAKEVLKEKVSDGKGGLRVRTQDEFTDEVMKRAGFSKKFPVPEKVGAEIRGGLGTNPQPKLSDEQSSYNDRYDSTRNRLDALYARAQELNTAKFLEKYRTDRIVHEMDSVQPDVDNVPVTPEEYESDVMYDIYSADKTDMEEEEELDRIKKLLRNKDTMLTPGEVPEMEARAKQLEGQGRQYHLKQTLDRTVPYLGGFKAVRSIYLHPSQMMDGLENSMKTDIDRLGLDYQDYDRYMYGLPSNSADVPDDDVFGARRKYIQDYADTQMMNSLENSMKTDIDRLGLDYQDYDRYMYGLPSNSRDVPDGDVFGARRRYIQDYADNINGSRGEGVPPVDPSDLYDLNIRRDRFNTLYNDYYKGVQDPPVPKLLGSRPYDPSAPPETPKTPPTPPELPKAPETTTETPKVEQVKPTPAQDAKDINDTDDTKKDDTMVKSLPMMSLKDMMNAIRKSDSKEGHPYGKPVQGSVFAYGSTVASLGDEKDCAMPEAPAKGQVNGEGITTRKLDL